MNNNNNNFPQSWPHHDLLSRNVLGFAIRMLPPRGGITQSAIDRWSDCIGQYRDSRHLGTLSTILQNFTHNGTQWPTAPRWCHFALRDVSCRQSWHLWTPSHPQVILDNCSSYMPADHVLHIRCPLYYVFSIEDLSQTF